MTDEGRAAELYQLALDLPPAERDAFLRRECRGDQDLEQRVRGLLAHFEAAPDDFLQSPSPLWKGERTPESVGPYDLKEVLGEGGMGVVYRAEQHEPVRRSVALKIVKLGMDTREVIARFDGERQALAQLEHPNIARVYDAGTTPDGRPYFAMEYVEGQPITSYCDEARLTPPQRIELLADVCRGVQHAHQHGIIHRDLKPTNILVTTQDGRPVPKIIDFGVAKATERRLTEATLFTEHGQLIGTPEYMSPEQAQGAGVDTRSDIYSLGVVLYELLAGSLPLDAVALRGAGFEAMMRMIRDEEPPRPSTRVSTLGDSAGATARRRRTEPRSLIRALRGELDWIAMKALEKDRERRYSTVAELAADLRAHLEDRPVSARPHSTWYTLRKLARRHRVEVAFATVIVVGLVGLAAAMSLQARRIAQERDRANQEAQVADQVKQFLLDLFEVSEPDNARGEEVTVREVVDEAAERIDELEDPEVRAELLSALGHLYYGLGHHDEAERAFQRARELWLQLYGPAHPHALSNLNNLGNVVTAMGYYTEAESLYGSAVAGWHAIDMSEDTRSLDPRVNLGTTYRRLGRYAEAESVLSEVLVLQRDAMGERDPSVLRIQANLADVYRRQDRLEEAVEGYEAAIGAMREVRGEDHPQTLTYMSALAWIYVDLERYDDAEELLQVVVDGERRVRGEDHPAYFTAVEAMGYLHFRRQELDDAQRCFETVLQDRRRVLGPEHSATIVAMNNLGGVYSAREQFREALQMHVEVLEIRRRVEGEDHPNTNSSRVNVALTSAKLGDYRAALRWLQDAVDRGWANRFLLRDAVQEALEPLHGDPAYEALLQEVRQRLDRD